MPQKYSKNVTGLKKIPNIEPTHKLNQTNTKIFLMFWLDTYTFWKVLH